MTGGDFLNFHNVLIFLCFFGISRHEKDRSVNRSFSGEGISFLMGCSKNYIMYWGGYVYYNSIGAKISVHKHRFISISFLCKSTLSPEMSSKIRLKFA